MQRCGKKTQKRIRWKTTRSISKIPVFFSHSSIVCCLLNSLKRNVSANDGTGSVVSFHPGKIWTKHQCWRHSRDPPTTRANMAATTPMWNLKMMAASIHDFIFFSRHLSLIPTYCFFVQMPSCHVYYFICVMFFLQGFLSRPSGGYLVSGRW